MARPIPLHEELMLLALRDREGTTLAGTMYVYGLAGAMLSELVLRERIRIATDSKKRVAVIDSAPTGEELLDEWLGKMREVEKLRRAADWIGRIATSKELKHRVARALVRRGILRADEESVLWVFTRRIYPEVDPRPERELLSRMRGAIFGDGEVDSRTTVLVTLADQTGVLRHTFDRKELRSRKDRLKAIAEGDAVADATASAIEAVRMAIMVSTMVPAIVTTSVVTS